MGLYGSFFVPILSSNLILKSKLVALVFGLLLRIFETTVEIISYSSYNAELH